MCTDATPSAKADAADRWARSERFGKVVDYVGRVLACGARGHAADLRLVEEALSGRVEERNVVGNAPEGWQCSGTLALPFITGQTFELC